MNTYLNRRNKLLEKLKDGLVIVPSAELKQRSNDTEYPFRQNSNFFYLTGFNEHNSILMLKKEGGKIEQTIFLEKKVPEMELWTGKRLGEKEAPKKLLLDKAYPIEEFNKVLEQELDGMKRIYISAFEQTEVQKLVDKTCHKLWSSRRKQGHLPHEIIHLDYLIESMRLVKEEEEIQSIKKAAELTTTAHLACMAKLDTAKNERDIEAVLSYFFRSGGGSGEAYTPIVAGGNNANVLHYIENNSPLNKGELLLIDAGAEYGLYACDVTRTIPIGGKFTETQKKIYNIVLDAQKKAIAMAKPGVDLPEIHKAASISLIEGLISLGLLNGNPEDIFKSGEHKKYYPHGTGHWLGLDVHDQCPYLDDQINNITLQENMYFTIEPGLYFDEEDLSLPEELRGIGIRIEDDILITKDGNEVITKDIPKEVSDVEEACQKDFLSYF